MRDVTLFCEDSFHEKFVGALLHRYSREFCVSINPRFFSARGGISKVKSEFAEFLRDLAKDRQRLPDSLIVVVDANCEGYNSRKKLMEDVGARYPPFRQLISYAIPDPHIERWMLVDPRSFQAVFNRGCSLPHSKCAKDEYKKILRREIRESGIEAPLGGEEFAEDIVMAMDLGLAEVRDSSLGLFLKSLKGLFNSWKAQ